MRRSSKSFFPPYSHLYTSSLSTKFRFIAVPEKRLNVIPKFGRWRGSHTEADPNSCPWKYSWNIVTGWEGESEKCPTSCLNLNNVVHLFHAALYPEVCWNVCQQNKITASYWCSTHLSVTCFLSLLHRSYQRFYALLKDTLAVVVQFFSFTSLTQISSAVILNQQSSATISLPHWETSVINCRVAPEWINHWCTTKAKVSLPGHPFDVARFVYQSQASATT